MRNEGRAKKLIDRGSFVFKKNVCVTALHPAIIFNGFPTFQVMVGKAAFVAPDPDALVAEQMAYAKAQTLVKQGDPAIFTLTQRLVIEMGIADEDVVLESWGCINSLVRLESFRPRSDG